MLKPLRFLWLPNTGGGSFYPLVQLTPFSFIITIKQKWAFNSMELGTNKQNVIVSWFTFLVLVNIIYIIHCNSNIDHLYSRWKLLQCESLILPALLMWKKWHLCLTLPRLLCDNFILLYYASFTRTHFFNVSYFPAIYL